MCELAAKEFTEDSEYLKTFAMIAMLSYDIYTKKQLIERLIDSIIEKENDKKSNNKTTDNKTVDNKAADKAAKEQRKQMEKQAKAAAKKDKS